MKRPHPFALRALSVLLRAFGPRPLAAALAAVLLLASLPAWAQAPRLAAPVVRGTIALSVPGQAAGPLVLSIKDSAFFGELLIENRGTQPLGVSRIAVRGDDDDVRAPSKLSARLSDGGGTAVTIPPGGSRKVSVTWIPERDLRVRQVFAHVMITSSDESAGEVAMGVTAAVAQPLDAVTSHALSWLVFLPLGCALVLLAMALTGQPDDDRPRKVAIGVAIAQCLLALWLYDGFVPDVGRVDGNDGYQFIEHSVWIRSLGIEYFVGVDGVSLPMVLLTSVLGLVAVVATPPTTARPKAFYAILMALLAGAMGVFVALDLVLFFFFWQLVLAALYFLLAQWGGARGGPAALKLLMIGLLGSALMLFATLALWTHSDHTFLVDGAPTARSFSIPELMRVAFHTKKALVLGLPLVKVAWIAFFLAFGALLPMVPLHRWLPDALATAPTPVAILLAGVGLDLGAYGILRVCLGVLPEGSRWAASTIVALGVVGVVYGALCAAAQTDLRRLFAYASVSQMGFCLVGLGSLTPQGIAACLVQMTSHGLVSALLLVLFDALESRARTRDVARLGGLGTDAPLSAAMLALGLLGSVGVPGLLGFWGEALALLGAFPLHRVMTLVAALGMALTAAYHVGIIHRLVFGKLSEALRTGPALAPFGGKLPELTSRELALVGPLALLLVVLGVWPAPLLGLVSGGVRDATALVNPPGPEQIALFWP